MGSNMETDSPATDPFDWTIDEVVLYLCHSSFDGWCRSKVPPPRPKAEILEKALRDNDVTGHVLLTEVNKQILAEDLALKSLGQRATISQAVQYLQSISAKYQEFVGSTNATREPCAPSRSPTTFSLPAPIDHTNLPNGTAVVKKSTSTETPSDPIEAFQAPIQIETVARRGEHLVVGKNGKKQRRLNLSSDVAKPHSSQGKYLADSKLTASDIFYNDSIDHKSKFSGEDDDNEFSLRDSNPYPTGNRQAINNKMKYYFRQEPRHFRTREGKPAVALFPYHSNPNGDRHFTLFHKNEDDIQVTKESVADWPEFAIEYDSKLQYLLAKYPPGVDEDALPTYGESASEGGYDSETWKEIESETKLSSAFNTSKTLSSAEVDAIIDKYIDAVSNKWKNEKQCQEEHKARRIWLCAQDNRLACIKTASKRIADMDRRLKDQRKAIKKSQWSQEKHLQAQCQSMEQTVFDRESQKWLKTVLELQKCPPKIAKPQIMRRKPRQRTQLPDDEESLGSDTEQSDSSVDNFIVPDENPPIPTLQGSGLIPTIEESDQDVVSPRKKIKLHKDRRNSIVKLSQRKLIDRDIVDLTRSDSDTGNKRTNGRSRSTFDVRTPPLNARPQMNTTPLHLLQSVESSPMSIASSNSLGIPDLNFKEILRRSDEDLVQNRTHLLVFYACSMLDKDREGITKILKKPFRTVKEIVHRCLKALNEREYELPDFPEQETNWYMRLAAIFVSWINLEKLQEDKGLNRKGIREALRKEKRIRRFLPLFKNILSESYAQFPRDKAPSPSSSNDPSNQVDEDDDLPDVADTPHGRKRKRPVKQSQEVLDTQKDAHHRVQLQKRQQQRLLKSLENSGVTNSDPTRKAVTFTQPVIYLDPHLGQHVRAHQLQGIQFMWRELVKDKKRQGCLLSHTMGLGKTMQVISFLVTIADAANSPDPKIQKQVPDCFRNSRTLILCPSSLVPNWCEELVKWIPKNSKKHLGPINSIESCLSNESRLEAIEDWYEEGGILLISYDIFRILVLNRATLKKAAPLKDFQHEVVRMQLLDGPHIIVADEAHKMKNQKCGVAEAASGFRSKSRIALTGSPLANHLEEYYAMIDWIAPGYLGDKVQFKAKYIEPIEAGLYVDSSPFERRQSLKKLQVLKKDLDPKVNRADISVMKGDLPTKVEFMITLPLTPLQEQAYKIYIDSLKASDDVANVRVWAWLAMLSLLCNHPWCFLERLKNNKDRNMKRSLLESEDESPGPADTLDLTTDISNGLERDLRNVFGNVGDKQSTDLSHRALMLEQIIRESLNAGDKVLVFSHSIRTLSYIEDLLRRNKWDFLTLYGSTPISSRQEATKAFNQPTSKEKIYLISTRAGGLGLNITGANRVIIFDFGFNPTWEEQAVGRSYRFGQTKPVFVYRFLAGGTYEDALHNKTVFKTQLSYRVIDKKNPIRFASKSQKEYLFLPKEVKQQDLSEFKGRDTQVLDKILSKPNFVRRIALTETFQREDDDKLTPEEEKAVQEELDDERLKRNDPKAWERKQMEIQKQNAETLNFEQAENRKQALAIAMQPKPFRINNVSFDLQPQRIPMELPRMGDLTVPTSRARNMEAPNPSVPPARSPYLANGPPPLQPDMSLYPRPFSQPYPTNSAPFGYHSMATMDPPGLPPSLPSTSIPEGNFQNPVRFAFPQQQQAFRVPNNHPPPFPRNINRGTRFVPHPNVVPSNAHPYSSPYPSTPHNGFPPAPCTSPIARPSSEVIAAPPVPRANTSHPESSSSMQTPTISHAPLPKALDNFNDGDHNPTNPPSPVAVVVAAVDSNVERRSPVNSPPAPGSVTTAALIDSNLIRPNPVNPPAPCPKTAVNADANSKKQNTVISPKNLEDLPCALASVSLDTKHQSLVRPRPPSPSPPSTGVLPPTKPAEPTPPRKSTSPDPKNSKITTSSAMEVAESLSKSARQSPMSTHSIESPSQLLTSELNGFDGAAEGDQQDDAMSLSSGHSPKTPEVEEPTTRCATQ